MKSIKNKILLSLFLYNIASTETVSAMTMIGGGQAAPVAQSAPALGTASPQSALNTLGAPIAQSLANLISNIGKQQSDVPSQNSQQNSGGLLSFTPGGTSSSSNPAAAMLNTIQQSIQPNVVNAATPGQNSSTMPLVAGQVIPGMTQTAQSTSTISPATPLLQQGQQPGAVQVGQAPVYNITVNNNNSTTNTTTVDLTKGVLPNGYKQAVDSSGAPIPAQQKIDSATGKPAFDQLGMPVMLVAAVKADGSPVVLEQSKSQNGSPSIVEVAKTPDGKTISTPVALPVSSPTATAITPSPANPIESSLMDPAKLDYILLNPYENAENLSVYQKILDAAMQDQEAREALEKIKGDVNEKDAPIAKRPILKPFALRMSNAVVQQKQQEQKAIQDQQALVQQQALQAQQIKAQEQAEVDALRSENLKQLSAFYKNVNPDVMQDMVDDIINQTNGASLNPSQGAQPVNGAPIQPAPVVQPVSSVAVAGSVPPAAGAQVATTTQPAVSAPANAPSIQPAPVSAQPAPSMPAAGGPATGSIAEKLANLQMPSIPKL